MSRNAAENFHEHTTNLPFELTPIAGRDGFEVVARNISLLGGFGVAKQKEGGFDMVVRLGHAPFGSDKDRETNRCQDVARLADILEQAAWPVGTFLVLYDKEEVDKKLPNWWLTEIFFKMVYVGDSQLT